MAYKKLKHWFDEALVKDLALRITVVKPDFPVKEFKSLACADLDALELKPRVEKIADALFDAFDKHYEDAVQTQLACIGPENPEETGMFTNFYWLMPFAKMVEKYGLDQTDLSFRAMEEITKRHTAEYTIRPYILEHYEATMSKAEEWSMSQNFHLRRLACEGIRPRLPWAKKLDLFVEDPSPILPTLNRLKDDPSKYVQNSVANSINDILKDNEHVGRALLNSWIDGATPSRKWIVKHAIRNYRKNDVPWSLVMLKDLDA